MATRPSRLANCNRSCKDCQSYVSQQFRNFFSTYTKAINKAYNHTGSLFEKPFKRKLVDDERYFTTLITYIHRNTAIPKRTALWMIFGNSPGLLTTHCWQKSQRRCSVKLYWNGSATGSRWPMRICAMGMKG